MGWTDPESVRAREAKAARWQAENPELYLMLTRLAEIQEWLPTWPRSFVPSVLHCLTVCGTPPTEKQAAKIRELYQQYGRVHFEGGRVNE